MFQKNRSCVLFFTLLIATPLAARDLQVHPKRVVFEKGSRTHVLELTNKGDKQTTYRLSWIRVNMNEEGGFVPVDPAAPGMYSDPYVRFFPRQITLASGQSQAVRLLLRAPADLEEGEYRSHLALTPVLDNGQAGLNAETLDEAGSKLGVRVISVVSITLPVILRQGRLDGSAHIDQLSLSLMKKATDPEQEPKENLVLSMNLHRGGLASIHGNLTAVFVDGQGRETLLGVMKGLAVYSNLQSRKVYMTLDMPESLRQGHGRITVAMNEPPERGGALIASAEMEH